MTCRETKLYMLRRLGTALVRVLSGFITKGSLAFQHPTRNSPPFWVCIKVHLGPRLTPPAPHRCGRSSRRGGARTQDAGTVTMSSSQRKGTAKFGGVVAEDSISGASAEHTGAQEEAVAYNLHVLHVVDQLQNGNCGALALCVLFLALGICCFTLGVFTLAMNEFFLGRMLRAAHGLLNASAWRCHSLTAWPPRASPGS